MDQTTARRIETDPNYQKLVSERKSLGWTLAIITLVMYYGYIAIVAFAPRSSRLRSSVTSPSGSFSGLRLFSASILLTGIYVVRANSRIRRPDQRDRLAANKSGGK